MDKLPQLEQTNQQLKQANTGVIIFKRGSKLSLRSMLSDKHGNGFCQQTIALGIYANAAGIKQAKPEARKLGSAIALKEFNWDNYLNRDRVVGSIENWIEKFEQNYFAKRERNLSNSHLQSISESDCFSFRRFYPAFRYHNKIKYLFEIR